MTSEVATVGPDASLKDAARELVEHEVSGMPVVDADGGLLGVISETDVLIKERGETLDDRGALRRLLDRHASADERKLQASTAGEAMTAPAITVGPFWSIPGAAERMLAHGIKQLPVVSRGRLVGMVTRSDLVRAFARTDAEIGPEVRERISIQQAVVGDMRPVSVVVENGHVTLTGRLARRTSAEALVHEARRTAGVVGVTSELTWDADDR
jgi:CBS domain-containing protein